MSKAFSSPALQQVNLEAESIIKSHLEAISRVSDDIRTLEVTLQKSAIPFVYVYIFHVTRNVSQGNSFSSYSDEIPYMSDIITYEEHCLVWGKGRENEPRFFYNIYVTEDEAHSVYDPSAPAALDIGKPSLKFSKPVCETKSNFRMQIENELPNFYRRIIHHLKPKNTSDCIIEQSFGSELREKSVLIERGLPE